MKRFYLLTCLSVLPVPAWAQAACDVDDDCAPGFSCDLAPQVPTAGSPQSPSPEDAEGAAAPAPCPPDEDCAAPSDEADAPPPEAAPGAAATASASDAEAAAGRSTNPAGDAPSARAGTCEPAPWLCQQDSDCPDLTRCDGGECVYPLVLCETVGGACADPGFVCTVLGESGSESSEPAGTTSPPVPDADGSLGASTNGGEEGSLAAPDAPAETLSADSAGVAEPGEGSGGGGDSAGEGGGEDSAGEDSAGDEPGTELRACFPEPQPCESAADCTGDWDCVELPGKLPGPWAGVEHACFPEAIAALLSGRIDVDPASVPDGWGGTASDLSSGNEASGGEPDVDQGGGPRVDDSPAQAGEVELGTQGGSEGSLGCAMQPGPERSGYGAFAGALVALVWAGRRRGLRRARR